MIDERHLVGLAMGCTIAGVFCVAYIIWKHLITPESRSLGKFGKGLYLALGSTVFGFIVSQ